MLWHVKPFLVDTHCHVHFPAYDQDREAVLARMRDKKIWAITIGTAMENSKQGIAFAEQHSDIWTTVGLHPSHTTHSHEDENEGAVHEKDVTKETLIEIAKSSKKVVAIGEAGLDFYRLDQVADAEAAKAIQERVFREHLLAAQELDLPVVIHCRDALTRLAEILQDVGKIRGVVHSFTGTWEEAKPLIDLGMHIAVNGIATFQKGFPITITAAESGGVLDTFGTNRANVVGDPNGGSTGTIASWFNKSAFAQPAPGVFGDSGRNILRAPGINNFDLSLFKNFAITERMRIQFRVESFNAFNHTQFGGPVTNVTSPQFGQILSARPARINQLGLKFIW